MALARALVILAAAASASENVENCEGGDLMCSEGTPRASSVMLQRGRLGSLIEVKEEGGPLSLLGLSEVVKAAQSRNLGAKDALEQSQHLLEVLKSIDAGSNDTTHLSGIDRQVLINVTNVLETTMMNNIDTMHNEDEQEINTTWAEFGKCKKTKDDGHTGNQSSAFDTYNKSIMNHKECRDSQATANASNRSAWLEYKAMETTIKTPPACMAYKAVLKPDMENYFSDKNQYIEWYKKWKPIFLAAKWKYYNASDDIDDNVTACDNNQTTLETTYCEYKRAVESICNNYDTCYSDALTDYNAAKKRVTDSVAARKMFFKSAKLVVCHIRVILQHDKSTGETQTFEDCRTLASNLDDSKYDIFYPAIPAKEPCDKSMVQYDTCDQAWRDLVYGGLLPDSPPKECTYSCSTTNTTV